MQVLFSADWHIKLGQKNVPREWQSNRYSMLFEKLKDLENEADIHIIGGDVFDTIPKPDEIALFLDFVSGCKIPTYIFDGNHEATRKGKTFLSFFKNAVKNINKNVEILDGESCIEGIIDVIPYTHLKTFNPDTFNNSILSTHVRGNIPPHVVEEIDLDKFSKWDLVLAGDLHAHSNSQKNIVYPGSPLSITFHRKKVDNGVIILDTDTLEYRFVSLGLPQLIRKTVDNSDLIVKTSYDHTIYEVTGNMLELSTIDTASDLIDKKVINNKSESRLDLNNMTIEEELTHYFESVLNIDSDNIESIMKVYNDYN